MSNVQQDEAEGLKPPIRDRRAHKRMDVDENAVLLLVGHGAETPCRVMDISLGGCRLRSAQPFHAGLRVRVEVTFKVRGFAFRLSGITQWTDGRNLIGIAFTSLTARRCDELAEALAEVEQQHVERLARAAAEAARRAEHDAAEAAEAQAAWEKERQQTLSRLAEKPFDAAFSVKAGPATANNAPAKPVPTDSPASADPLAPRMAQTRFALDVSAVVHLVNIKSMIPGHICDLSMGGCHIRTAERFPVGIYTRVETEFKLQGLPLRLGGVVQTIYDRCNIGIRFLDLSDRKREQLAQLIAEIEAAR